MGITWQQIKSIITYITERGQKFGFWALILILTGMVTGVFTMKEYYKYRVNESIKLGGFIDAKGVIYDIIPRK